MNKTLKTLKIKPLDIVLALVLLLASFSPLLIFAKTAQAGTQAVLKHDGQTVQTFDLAKNQDYTYDNNGKICKIQVRQGKIRVVWANCPTNICVKTGWTNSPNKTIICLPHGNVISVLGEKTPVKQDGKVVDYGG